MGKTSQKSGMKSISALLTASMLLVFACVLAGSAQNQAAAAKIVGTVKSVNATSIILTTDAGAEATVTFSDSARIVRATPGQTDLKSAPAIQISDIQIGDRVAARGQSGEGVGFIASVALVMKQGDIAQRQQAERDEWRRGVGGIVKDVNASGGTITIANSLAAAGGKPIVIHVGAGTEIKRYAPDSVKFDDAKPGTLDQIKPGDQVRARGTKNSDGTEFTAQAIVSGSFKDLAGTVISTDAGSSSITISDLATKKPVTVKVGPDSMLRKLPQFVAMRWAARLKGSSGEGTQSSGPQPNGNQQNSAGSQHANSAGEPAGPGEPPPAGGSGMGPGGTWRGNGNGTPDLQQILTRMPAMSISDLSKGDAVILVATEGTATSPPTAITLLSGVEPILSASPGGTSAATILSPWNLGEAAGGGGEAAVQ